ncbi:MAG TPA: 2-hydroxyacid dehydrogenase [Burkholderiales bacterium]|nr:2-hydroxyacid dehydrogenase [Burkholderiales bacterium]
MKPDLLLICPLFPATMKQLDDAYTVHRYYQATDKDAFVAGLADRITAAATAGHEGMSVALMNKLPKLKIISCFGVGVDGIDVPAAKKLGIAVTNTPDVLTECVADNAMALVLSTMRRTVFNDKFVRAGNWLKGGAPLADKVSGNRMGIIGLGRIGKAIAKRAEAFGMKISYHTRTKQNGVSYDYYDKPVQLARDVKVLVVACPGGKETERIVSKDVLDALGKDAYLINVSRGSTIDEPAMVDALVNGRLAGAGLDVFVAEPKVPEALFKLDNVVLQPHVSSGTHWTRAAMGQLVVDNLAAFFAGKPLLTPV